MIDRWHWHGGGLGAARAYFGEVDAPWIDLSTGINPQPWPIPPLAIDWARLPDDAALRALEAAAAAHVGVDPATVCALPGTEIGLRLIGDLLPGPACYITPAYRTHGEMIDGSIPLGRAHLAEADDQTLILANPNNPDGHRFDHPTLHDLLARRGEGWLVIDEAFADTDPTFSFADQVSDDCRLLVFRSFGKFFGAAGVRLGFLIAPPAILAAVRRKLGAWPLSAPAIAIGTAAYRDQLWIAATRQRLGQQASALDALLTRCGYSPVGNCPLFRLIEADDAPALFDRLARRAILTRPFLEQPHWLRIGLPADAAACDRLEAALRHG
ncbi:threonine-phosphate decarboxylase [Sphingobium sp. D43FB]|uniref:threonine-phosphate decarboxylase n=1 Tax=Sphingobium sp. D43FB TaxID=2017595 RepID=UPI000BB532A7|nr:threonine-phosphate decarboxylase [Sphingobium sp. D43FB]PBN44605.1 threonine-phosphate decarboxylase [Sphingobium sp. D43FB]